MIGSSTWKHTKLNHWFLGYLMLEEGDCLFGCVLALDDWKRKLNAFCARRRRRRRLWRRVLSWLISSRAAFCSSVVVICRPWIDLVRWKSSGHMHPIWALKLMDWTDWRDWSQEFERQSTVSFACSSLANTRTHLCMPVTVTRASAGLPADLRTAKHGQKWSLEKRSWAIQDGIYDGLRYMGIVWTYSTRKPPWSESVNPKQHDDHDEPKLLIGPIL